MQDPTGSIFSSENVLGTGPTHILCEILHMGQARRMILAEIQKVLESCSADRHRQACVSSATDVCEEAWDAISREHGSVALGVTSKVQLFVSFCLAVALWCWGTQLRAGSVAYQWKPVLGLAHIWVVLDRSLSDMFIRACPGAWCQSELPGGRLLSWMFYIILNHTKWFSSYTKWFH